MDGAIPGAPDGDSDRPGGGFPGVGEPPPDDDLGAGAELVAGPRARRRLIVLLVLLVALYGFVWLARPVSQDAVQDWIAPWGALAPLAFLLVAVALGLALVPGPLMAGAAGLLFGTALGTVVTVSAAVVTAVLALLIARRAGRPGVDALDSRRIQAISRVLERHGLWAVIVQRLAPGVPDAPCSYAAGLLRVRVSHIALGTLLGAAPRAFGYSALGDSLDAPGSPLGFLGLGVVVLTAVVGAVLARRLFVLTRRDRARAAGLPGNAGQPPSSGGSARGPSG